MIRSLLGRLEKRQNHGLDGIHGSEQKEQTEDGRERWGARGLDPLSLGVAASRCLLPLPRRRRDRSTWFCQSGPGILICGSCLGVLGEEQGMLPLTCITLPFPSGSLLLPVSCLRCSCRPGWTVLLLCTVLRRCSAWCCVASSSGLAFFHHLLRHLESHPVYGP